MLLFEFIEFRESALNLGMGNPPHSWKQRLLFVGIVFRRGFAEIAQGGVERPLRLGRRRPVDDLRHAFERYLAHWIDAVHAARPSLQLTSNWMYTSFAPKPVEAKLDFLSGDYSPSLSVDRARLEARYLASTGRPWDLMAWGFDKSQGLGWSIKPAVHLMQEAAVVLMQGGGFQIYHTPTRSGAVVEPIIAQEEAVAAFNEKRRPIFKGR